MDIVDGNRGNRLPVAGLEIVPQGRESTKVERPPIEQKRLREDCLYCFQYLVPDIAILLCPYNHSQQLEEVGADGTSTYPKDPIQEEENDYKKGSKEKQGGGGEGRRRNP